MLTALLAAGAFCAGLAGTWSPCGFSMVETIGPAGHDGPLRSTLAACASFALGALAGGGAAFGVLALAGRAAGSPAPTIAIVAAVLGAAADAAGLPVRPQIRRQLPEPWRRTLPLPLAALGYGILLGLGFTTFVLCFGTWAIAGVVFAVGDPMTGFATGLAFGAGRALPIVLLAPLARRPIGFRLLESMAARPAALRATRLAVAAALAATAATLAVGRASAAPGVFRPAVDPTVAGTDVAWQVPGGHGVLLRDGATTPLPGDDPALGGASVAWHVGGTVTIADRATLAPARTLAVPAVDALAISDDWLVARQPRRDGGARLVAFDLATGRLRDVASVAFPAQLSRPSLQGSVVAYGRADRRSSKLVLVNLRNGDRWVVRTSAGAQLLNPALRGPYLLYVRLTDCDQELRLGPLGAARDRVLLSRPAPIARDRGHEQGHTEQGSEASRCPGGTRPGSRLFWTTALTSRVAYLSEFSPAAPAASAEIEAVPR